MSEEKRMTDADKAFAISGFIAITIDSLQKVVKAPMSAVMSVADGYPKFLILKWIPQGVEMAIGFTDDGYSYKLYEPEGLLDFPIEYQELLAKIHVAMGQLGFLKIKGDKK